MNETVLVVKSRKKTKGKVINLIVNTKTLKTKNWQHKRNTIGDIVQDEMDVEQCIKTIAGTLKGSVPLMPELGCDTISAVGEKGGNAIDRLITIYTKEIPKQEPRCEILFITGEYSEDGRVHMKINYKYKNTNNVTEVYI